MAFAEKMQTKSKRNPMREREEKNGTPNTTPRYENGTAAKFVGNVCLYLNSMNGKKRRAQIQPIDSGSTIVVHCTVHTRNE